MTGDKKESKKQWILLRSEPVQEILGTIPPWLVRWGITMFFIIIVTLIVGSWFFKYPDFLNAEIEVVTQNPPVDVVSKADGKIEMLFVDDKDYVSRDEILAIIENPADHTQVFDLKEEMAGLKPYIEIKETDSLPEFQYYKYSDLGENQVIYSLFLKSYLDYQNYFEVDYYRQKIEALEDQISDHNTFYQYTYAQRQTLEENYQLSEKNYNRNVLLFEQGAIAEVELEKIKGEMLQKKQDFEAARINLANARIKITELKEDKLDLQLQDTKDLKQLKLALQESFGNLSGQIAIWEQNYAILAPISGDVTFNKFWSANQNVTVGEKVFSIVPSDSSNIIGKMLMPIRGSGKVRPGQKVNIKFYNYPYMEFGMVTGRIKNISTVPSDNVYSVEVSFPDGLKSNYGIVLDFNQKMKGMAEIITDEVRLLVRMVLPVKSLIKNRTLKEYYPENDINNQE